MTYPIVDLHCDLLLYLQGHSQRSPHDLVSRAAIGQLHIGNVKLQTFAIFTQTNRESVQKGFHQLRLYQDLLTYYPMEMIAFSKWDPNSSLISLIMAIENASGFCDEQEALSEGFKRLHDMIQSIGRPLYISLTWNEENRFGGGASTKIGLKEDGKRLLEELHEKKIAVDLSHASDRLAYDIIDYIEGCRLQIPLIASHSNARSIRSVPRNLPDELAVEIFRRQGVIGLNLCWNFVGVKEEDIVKHIAHWLELGGENSIAFGADFFYEGDVPSSLRHGHDVFFPNYQDASCYGKLLNFLQKELRLTSILLEKLAYQNALNFINLG